MKKVSLFSFLGNMNYNEIVYHTPSGKTIRDKYAQMAICDYLLESYDKINIKIFLTESARGKNWESNESEGLSQKLLDLDKDKISIKSIAIPENQDEQANWQLFHILLSEIQENERIYFDMTYGYRSIPFISFIVLQYARNLKNLSFGGLLYAMVDPQKGEAIINDLSEMMKLTNWADGVNQYVRTGNAKLISSLVSQEMQVHKNSSNQEDAGEIETLQNISKQMNNINENFETVRSEKIIDELHKLRTMIHNLSFSKSSYLKALVPIIDKVKDKLDGFGENQASQIKFIINWCIEHGLYQQAYTFLLEFIISGFCNLLKRNKYKFNNRNIVQSTIQVIQNDYPEKDWKVSKKNKSHIRSIIRNGQLNPYKKYFNAYVQLNKDRNDINHGGVNKFNNRFEDFERRINRYKKELFPLIDILYKKGS